MRGGVRGGAAGAEGPAFQPGVSGAGSGQQDPRRPAAGGQQPAQLVRLRVPRQPRRGEPAAGPGGLALDLLLAPSVGLGRQVAPHGREDLLLFVGDVLLEHVAQFADRCAQSSGRARFRAEAGHGLGGPAERRVDRLMVVGQRGQVHGLPGGGGDHRPDDVVLAVLVGEDLGQQRRGVAADGARPGRAARPRRRSRPRQAASRRRSWRIARWITTMEVRSGSGSCVVLVLSANGGAVVTFRAWAGALAADLRPTCGPVAALPE